MNILHLVNKYPDKPWDWYYISYNKNITMNDILNNPDKPWNWYAVSQKSNITIDFIENNIDKIDFKILSRNTFIDKEPFLKLLLNIMHYDILSIILGYV